MPTHAQFEEHQEAAERAAAYIARSMNQPYEEALENAQVALFLLLQDDNGFDDSKGSLSKWLRVKIVYNLKELYARGNVPHYPDMALNNRRRELPYSETMERWGNGSASDAQPRAEARSSWLHSVLKEVSEECHSFLQILQEAPEDLMDELCPRQGRSSDTKQDNLRCWLVDVADWPPVQVDRVFEEIQGCL